MTAAVDQPPPAPAPRPNVMDHPVTFSLYRVCLSRVTAHAGRDGATLYLHRFTSRFVAEVVGLTAAREAAAAHGPGRYEVHPNAVFPIDLARWPEAEQRNWLAVHGLDRDGPIDQFDVPAGAGAGGAAPGVEYVGCDPTDPEPPPDAPANVAA